MALKKVFIVGKMVLIDVNGETHRLIQELIDECKKLMGVKLKLDTVVYVSVNHQLYNLRHAQEIEA